METARLETAIPEITILKLSQHRKNWDEPLCPVVARVSQYSMRHMNLFHLDEQKETAAISVGSLE
jgi:hypothetical protein